MRHYVIGTAGHIDHGKSALVKALTGTDPDRLDEEQRRGMTIDLGFAHFDLPGDRRVGIVDVPGHERLVRNMLAGATGIDLVLFVVAADEGVMPQTREHLDILRFLPVRSGIIVLNKIDLAPDPSWIALVREDLAGLVAGTFLEAAPVIAVSARTGEGIDALVAAIDRALQSVPPRAVDAPVRLPIDRAFTMAGFGTVVTGTLWSGRIAAGMTLELLPQGRLLRVRGLQSHGAARQEAEAGARVAVNLAGIEKDEIARGDVLATPGVFVPTTRLDVRVRLLPGAPRLPHRARVRLYLGSAEVVGWIVFHDRNGLAPGQDGAGQVRLDGPLVADAGDPFVLRRFAPMSTIGGGTVVDAHPPAGRRSRAARAGEDAAGAAAPTLTSRVEMGVLEGGPAGVVAEDLMRTAAATRGHVRAAVDALATEGRLVEVRGRIFHEDIAAEVARRIRAVAEDYHREEPWRGGVPKDELKRRAFPRGDDRLYALVLERLTRTGAVEDLGTLVRAAGFTPARSADDAALRTRIEETVRRGWFAPPGREEIARDELDRGVDARRFERMWRTLLDDGTVVDAGQGVFFHRDAVEAIQQAVAEEVRERGNVTVASLRTRLRTSRKYALTVLEYFDTIKVTRRMGDVRVLLDRQAGGVGGTSRPRPRQPRSLPR